MRIDGALAVLGRDDDQRGVVQAIFLKLFDHLADRSIHKLDLSQQQLTGRACSIQIPTAAYALFNQLLAHADRLEVHAEQVGHASAMSVVVLALDLLQDGLRLDGVVALNVGEAIRPGAGLRGVGNGFRN